MAEEWWSERQAVNYLVANYPCDSPLHAHAVIERMREAGQLAARYLMSDGSYVETVTSEGWLEVAATPLRQLCSPRPTLTAEELASLSEVATTRAPAGRPLSASRLLVEGAARFRLYHLGAVEKQADLERELAQWCEDERIELGDRTIRTAASNAMRAYRARLGAE